MSLRGGRLLGGGGGEGIVMKIYNSMKREKNHFKQFSEFIHKMNANKSNANDERKKNANNKLSFALISMPLYGRQSARTKSERTSG